MGETYLQFHDRYCEGGLDRCDLIDELWNAKVEIRHYEAIHAQLVQRISAEANQIAKEMSEGD